MYIFYIIQYIAHEECQEMGKSHANVSERENILMINIRENVSTCYCFYQILRVLFFTIAVAADIYYCCWRSY